jgi:hypothetical protein
MAAAMATAATTVFIAQSPDEDVKLMGPRSVNNVIAR